MSRRLSTQLRWLKRRTVELIEIPRCCSISIQSERVVRSPRRALTRPAVSIAPPYSRSFSVSVVFPASGWETMAEVRRRAASARSSSASWVCIKFLLSARGRLALGDVGFTPGNDRFAAETIHHCRPLHECEKRYQAKEQQHLPRCGHGGPVKGHARVDDISEGDAFGKPAEPTGALVRDKGCSGVLER